MNKNKDRLLCAKLGSARNDPLVSVKKLKVAIALKGTRNANHRTSLGQQVDRAYEVKRIVEISS